MELRPQILLVWEQALTVYGTDKTWHHLNHHDVIRVVRCIVERLMTDIGVQGRRRGRDWIRTTEGDDRLDCPTDLVECQFRAPVPSRLWDANFTYVKTHSGWVYVALIFDVHSQMIVGWQASSSLRSDPAIDALEMANFNRQRLGADLSQLTQHSDRGIRYLSVRNSEHLAENQIVASVGSKGESFYNALTESYNWLYKWELIYPKGPRRGFDAVECASLTNVNRFTIDAFTARSTPAPASQPRQPLRPPTTVKNTQPTRPRHKPPSHYETRGTSELDKTGKFQLVFETNRANSATFRKK